MTVTTIENFRMQFPILQKKIHGDKPFVYLDNAATTQKPKAVVDEMNDYYLNYCANVNRSSHFMAEQTTQKFQNARRKIANFIGARYEHEIIFTKGTTESINLVANGLKAYLNPEDEILLTQMEHHSNIVPWYLIAKEKGLKLKIVPVNDDGTLNLSVFYEMLTPKTKLACFTHASNALGTINPIKDMIAMANSKNIITVVDGAQAVSHMPVSVSDLNADFYAFSGHKGYGPCGIGVLFGKSDYLEKFMPYQSGGDMISQVSFEEISFAPLPQKFEAGTPNIAGAIGLAKAFEVILDCGFQNIMSHERALHDYALGKLKSIPKVSIFGEAKNKVSLISFCVEGIHPHDLSSIFDADGVAIRAGHLCAEPLVKRFNRSAFARVSMAYYNTFDDVDLFIKSFEKAFEVFGL